MNHTTKLFGTDGIRGEIGSQIQVFDVLKIAMASGLFFAKFAQKNISKERHNKILVGKDTRRSGYMIENAIVSGLTAMGYDVIQIGPMPTPAIAFLTKNMRCVGGIMISASHNPYPDNGIKFFQAGGDKLSTEQEQEIERLFHQDEELFKACKVGKAVGACKRIDDVIGRYIVHIKNSFPLPLTLNGLRIVLDTANGAGYKTAPTILEELGAELFVINDKPNGTNINDNCGALYPQDLAKEVLKVRADIGISLDGDGDRLVVVDEQGEQIDGDNLMAAIAIYLEQNGKLKGKGIITTIMSNGALDVFLNKQNIACYRSAVGDRNVTELMRQKGCNFGGEESGHIICSDYTTTGDGLLSSLQALAIIASTKQKASKALRKFVPFNRQMINLPVVEKKELSSIKGYQEQLATIEKKDIRAVIRYSGTENKLRILLEGKYSMEQLSKEIEQLKHMFTPIIL